MATIKFVLQSESNNAPIYLRLSLGKSRSEKRKTGLSINPKYWSTDTGLPKQTYSNGKSLASDLRKLNNVILDDVNEANSKGVELTGDWLKHRIDLHFGRTTENNQSELIVDAIQNIIDNAEFRKNAKGGIGLSKSRKNAYKSLKTILTEYQKDKRFKVKEVNIKFANTFLKYLLNEKNYSKSYALKKIADLKTVCFDAEAEGIKTHPQLKKIDSTKSKNENIIYLTPLELEKIANADIKSEALQNARKWLLLGCNIGQRGSDLLNLTENNFLIRNGLHVIELKQQKTEKLVTIPVLDKTKEILESGLPYKISIQKFNDYLKVICEKAEINQMTKGSKICMVDKEGNIIPDDQIKNYKKENKFKRSIEGIYPKHELIGSHVCRRSFATNLYGFLPTVLIMQVTAHSTEKMFLNYIGKNSLDYAQQIADFYTLQAQKQKKEPQLNLIKKAN